MVQPGDVAPDFTLRSTTGLWERAMRTERETDRNAGEQKMEVVIYKFTGWQGLFKIPEAWCRECDLLVRATQRALEQTGIRDSARFVIRPWFLWFWKPLRRGAWRAPILTINGRVVSQGIVPPVERIVEEMRREARERAQSCGQG
jgi:hypothetical protein